ncbi:MAG TPA: Xaa-Pro peptidase family protein [Methanotrichaceae archaeon]|nr:Xaa-Pro peptidase family protein [Methanotrichaceae archaeon]
MEYILHPKSEIDDRIKRFQAKMDGIAGALLFHSVDMCYFSGTAQDGLVYIPRDGEPVVMMRRSLERAMQESPLEVRPLKNMRNLKSDLDIPSGATVGLEMDVLPCNFYFRVANALGDAKFTDVSEEIKHVRSVKSDFEIDLIREAARILDAGIASVPDHIEEGMREVDLACRLESVMRSMGHQGSLRFRRFNSIVPLGHVMSGPNAAAPSFLASPTGGRGTSLLFPQGAGFGKIKRNEPVFVDMVGIYNGYIADATRIFSLGKLSAELEDAYLAALEIEEAVARELQPGKTGKELFGLSEAEGARRGYGDYLGGPVGSKCGFVGHGVGLELDEYPVLGPLNHAIEKNMTIAIEPKIIYPDKGVLGVEDTFLTTENGAQRLTRLSQEIWQV